MQSLSISKEANSRVEALREAGLNVPLSNYSVECLPLRLSRYQGAFQSCYSLIEPTSITRDIHWLVSEQTSPTAIVLDSYEEVRLSHSSWSTKFNSRQLQMGPRLLSTEVPLFSNAVDHLIQNIPWSDEVKEFARGFQGNTPSGDTVRIANQVYNAAKSQAVEYEFYVDDSDGALGIMLRLRNGLLLLAELSVGGTLSGGTYDDDEGARIQFLPNATVEQMVSLL